MPDVKQPNRVQVQLESGAEHDAVKAAAKADRRSVSAWARLILLDAAAAAGYHPPEVC